LFFGGRTTNKKKCDLKGETNDATLNPNTPEEIKENIKVEKIESNLSRN